MKTCKLTIAKKTVAELSNCNNSEMVTMITIRNEAVTMITIRNEAVTMITI